MEICLHQIDAVNYAVSCEEKAIKHYFSSIDKACDFLEELGVIDEQIDKALIDMLINKTVRAVFNEWGTFTHSDGVSLHS